MGMEFETVILRFRDLVTAEQETIAKHQDIIQNHQYVWWAWWKKGHEKLPVAELAFLEQKVKSAALDMWLVDSGQNLVYRATCTKIKMQYGENIPSPERDKTPAYYRDQEYCAWFKFSNIEPCSEDELRELSYVDCKALFGDENIDYSSFDNKKIYSIPELIQQNRTMWFVRHGTATDRDNEIVLLNSDLVQPTHFSKKYYQSNADMLLWLSDLHLSDDVFDMERCETHQTMAQHICNCVKDKAIAGLLISGDITSRGEERGFELAQQLLRDIGYETLSLNSENILICPGNHDFKREALDLPAGGAPVRISAKRENAEGFSSIYHSIYKLYPNEYFAGGKKLLLSSGHILEIVALNSVMLQQYPNFEGHGYLSQEQLDFVSKEMGWDSTGGENVIRIVMMHHHYLPTCHVETLDVPKASSCVYDADRFMNWMVKHKVKVLLHGHKHRSFMTRISYPMSPASKIDQEGLWNVTIVGMGGTGATSTDNKFATISFAGEKMTIEFYRIYSDNSTSDTCCQTIEIPL